MLNEDVMQTEFKEVIVEGLNSFNHLGWVLLQARDLKHGFKVPEETNGPEFETIHGKKHHLYDVIENLEMSVISGLGLGYAACLEEGIVAGPEHYQEFQDAILETFDELEFTMGAPVEDGYNTVLIIK